MKTKFYTYSQNNSGGGFDFDQSGISHFVIIEAESPQQADEKATSIGIYFNGCDDDIDCPCCGDRWYSASDYNESETPSIYGKHPSKYKCMFFKDKPHTFVHYTDGKIEPFSNSDN